MMLKRYLSFIWSYLECLGYGGIVFGWGSLVYVLKDEGLYLSLCDHDEDAGTTDTLLAAGNNSNVTTSLHEEPDDTCTAREEMFNLIFTVFTSILGLGLAVNGFVNLRFGTRVTRLIITVMLPIGGLCVANATTGMSLMGVAGAGVFATNCQVSFLFPVWGSMVISLLAGAFDASSAIQLLVKIGYENGVSRSTSYYILAGVFLMTLFNTFYLLPDKFIEKEKPQGDGDAVVVVPTNEKDGDTEAEAAHVENSESDDGKQPNVMTARKLVGVLISRDLLPHMLWLSILHLRHMNYLATINNVLEDILDTDDEVSRYTNEFLYILLAGMGVGVLPGLVYDYNVKMFQDSKSWLRRRLMPCVCPLAITSLVSIALSAFAIFTGPSTIYVEFVLVVFLRAFTYTTMNTYTRQLFPSGYFASLYGILFLVSGVVALLQYGLFSWMEDQGRTQVNVFLLVLCIITLVHPLFQWKRSRGPVDDL